MPIDDTYNDVASRMREFFAKYPDGSLQQRDVRVYEFGDLTFIAYTAAALRSPEDPEPGEGTAWERVPGLTNFTRNSELQNAETSAWGRAILAVGAADTKKGIASYDEIESRRAEDEQWRNEQEAVGGLRSSIIAAIEKLDPTQQDALKDWLKDNNLPAVRRMNQPQCDQVLDYLMTLPAGEAA